MEVYREITPLQQYLNKHRFRGEKIGLVPTMGALHEGHLSLLRTSLHENDITVCSIYVNPIQFNNREDLDHYPRLQEQDIALLKAAGCNAVFCPSDEMMYRQMPKIALNFGGLDDVMEGKFRPGHFNGVGLIVSKLFNIVDPAHAYFGQKDLQQFLIIKQLVTDLSFNVKLRCMPVIREADGLAMSSRNERLSAGGREKAAVLYRSLTKAQELLQAKINPTQIKNEVTGLLQEAGVQIEYIEIVNPETLGVPENIFSEKNVAICVAGYVENVRLIDNIIFKLDF